MPFRGRAVGHPFGTVLFAHFLMTRAEFWPFRCDVVTTRVNTSKRKDKVRSEEGRQPRLLFEAQATLGGSDAAAMTTPSDTCR